MFNLLKDGLGPMNSQPNSLRWILVLKAWKSLPVLSLRRWVRVVRVELTFSKTKSGIQLNF
jgi:hypothetical protein